MSNSSSDNDSGQQTSLTNAPGAPAKAGPAFEYIPCDAPRSATPPPLMQPPAYLYPMPSSLLTPAPRPRPVGGLALAGLLLGLASLVLWLIPPGGVVAIGGMAFSILGWRPPTPRWMPIVGCACSLAVLALGLYNVIENAIHFTH